VSNYTDEELKAAVSGFVRSEVKTQRDVLGPLSADYAFQEVKEFAASTLTFDPSSIFYLLSIVANRINQDVLQAIEYASDIKEAIFEVGSPTTKVTSTSKLADAAVALQEIDLLVTERNAVTERPFTRYKNALDEFTSLSLTPNIRRYSGEPFPNAFKISRPPQQAQSAIKSVVPSLRSVHTTILDEIAQIESSLAEFLAVNLPLITIQGSVRKIRADLTDIKNQFDTATADGAIALTRDAFLRIQAGRSVIDNLSTVSDPRSSRMKGSSQTSDRAQSSYAAGYSTSTPAKVVTSVSAPFRIIPGVNDSLRFSINGGAAQDVILVPDSPAQLDGAVSGTYNIHSQQSAFVQSSYPGPYTVPASPNNVFVVYVDGIGYQIGLVPASWSTGSLALGINLASRIDGQPGALGDVATASDNGGGYLRIQHNTPGAVHDITIGLQTAINSAFGFSDSQDSDDLVATKGVEANNSITFLMDDENVVTAPLTVGTRTEAQIVADIVAASPLITAEVASIPTLPSGTMDVVRVKSTFYGEGSSIKLDPQNDIDERTMQTLGFYQGPAVRSSYLSLDSLHDAVSTIPDLSLVRQEAVLQSGSGAMAVKIGTDFYLRFTAGSLDTSISVNEKLRIVSGDNIGYYPITAFIYGAYDYIKVGRALPVVTGAAADNQSWEVVRDLLSISSSTQDKTSSLEVLTTTNDAYTDLGLTTGLVYGSVSGVVIKDAGTPLSFARNDVRVGDRLSLNGPTYSTTHTVTAITESGYQIEVTPEVPNDLISHLYEINSGAWLLYSDFISDLGIWSASLEVSQFDADIQELERRLNPVIQNKNPSSTLVNDADTTVTSLIGLYTSLSSILSDFVVAPSVTRIDSILNMLEERGLRRAHDLLLLGKISEFFSLSKDGGSYSGKVLETMRSVAQSDVNVSTDVEMDHMDSHLNGSYSDTDADLDFSDGDREGGVTETDDIPDPTEEDDFLTETV
jgi:hypothetical protein